MVIAVLFDFDGVIVDTEHKKFSDLRILLKKYNLVLPDEVFFRFIGTKTEAFLRREFPELPSDTITQIVINRRKSVEQNIADYKVIPGLKNLLDYLKGHNIRASITTGSQRRVVERILTFHSLRDYFEVIISGDDHVESKPNPACYTETLKQLGVAACQTIAIEDSFSGIQAARGAGCEVYGLKTYFDEKQLHGASRCFTDHIEILTYLKSVLK